MVHNYCRTRKLLTDLVSCKQITKTKTIQTFKKWFSILHNLNCSLSIQLLNSLSLLNSFLHNLGPWDVRSMGSSSSGVGPNIQSGRLTWSQLCPSLTVPSVSWPFLWVPSGLWSTVAKEYRRVSAVCLSWGKSLNISALPFVPFTCFALIGTFIQQTFTALVYSLTLETIMPTMRSNKRKGLLQGLAWKQSLSKGGGEKRNEQIHFLPYRSIGQSKENQNATY